MSSASQHPPVRLVPATEALLLALRDDRAAFAELIDSDAPAGWPEFPEAIDYTLEQLRTVPEPDRAWTMQFFIDAATGALLGSGGFAGPPTGEAGHRAVEIGYEIAPEFRGRGFGAGSAHALVDAAFVSGAVDLVVARTLPGPNPSTGVLVSLGFEHTGEQEDPDEGTVWEWSLRRG